MKEYIHFVLYEEKPKTNIYKVLTNKTIIESGVLPQHIILGDIRWHPTWRQYVWSPSGNFDDIFSAGCLMQIVDFLKTVNKNHKFVPKIFDEKDSWYSITKAITTNSPVVNKELETKP